MKNAPIRFCGYTFHHNPSTLRIEHTGSFMELESPCCEPRTEHLSNRLRRISGEGEMYGADCIAQFRELQKLFDSCEAGLLSLPHLPVMVAYLKELRMTAEAKENLIEYRFVFLEARPRVAAADADTYDVIAEEGESLWNISYLRDIPIDTLVRLNPQIPMIDYLQEGERVRLC